VTCDIYFLEAMATRFGHYFKSFASLFQTSAGRCVKVKAINSILDFKLLPCSECCVLSYG